MYCSLVDMKLFTVNRKKRLIDYCKIVLTNGNQALDKVKRQM